MARDVGRVIDVRSGALWYPCCPTCLAKVCRDVCGRWCCPRNCGDLATLHYRYRLALLVSWPDSTVQSVVLFGKCLELIFGLPADEFVKYVEQRSIRHSAILDCLYDSLIGQQFIFETHGCINAAAAASTAEVVARGLYPERGLPFTTVHAHLAAEEQQPPPQSGSCESRRGGGSSQSLLHHRLSAECLTPVSCSRCWQLGSFFADASRSRSISARDSIYPVEAGAASSPERHCMHLNVCPPFVDPSQCLGDDRLGNLPAAARPGAREPSAIGSLLLSPSALPCAGLAASSVCSASGNWSSWRLDSDATVVLQSPRPAASPARNLGCTARMTPIGRRALSCGRLPRCRMPPGTFGTSQPAERRPLHRPLRELTALGVQCHKATDGSSSSSSDCINSWRSVTVTESVEHRCPLLNSPSAGRRDELCLSGSPLAFVHSTPLVTLPAAQRRAQLLLLSPVSASSSPRCFFSTPHSATVISRHRSSVTLFSQHEHSTLT